MKRSLGFCASAAAFVVLLATHASAQIVTLTANLNGGEETPAIINTGAVGTAEVSVDATNREVAVTLHVFNIPTTTTAGHIHIGPKGVGGPVVLNFPTTLPGKTGDFSMTFRLGAAAFVARPAIGVHTIDDAIQAIVGGNAYVNIHTTQYPGGEIRGQLAVK